MLLHLIFAVAYTAVVMHLGYRLNDAIRDIRTTRHQKAKARMLALRSEIRAEVMEELSKSRRRPAVSRNRLADVSSDS